jgi:hypothetical protein
MRKNKVHTTRLRKHTGLNNIIKKQIRPNDHNSKLKTIKN